VTRQTLTNAHPRTIGRTLSSASHEEIARVSSLPMCVQDGNLLRLIVPALGSKLAMDGASAGLLSFEPHRPRPSLRTRRVYEPSSGRGIWAGRGVNLSGSRNRYWWLGGLLRPVVHMKHVYTSAIRAYGLVGWAPAHVRSACSCRSRSTRGFSRPRGVVSEAQSSCFPLVLAGRSDWLPISGSNATG
jgi:hypothetical protein